MSKTIKKETVIQIGAICLTVAVFGAAVYAVTRMLNKNNGETSTTTYSRPTRQTPTFYYDGKYYHLKDDMEVFLVMGIDEPAEARGSTSYTTYSQADVLYVYAVDHANRTYQAIQLNRDTMTGVRQITAEGVDDIEQMQLCLAHSYGNSDTMRCENTVEAVSALLFDVPVDHYISLTLEAIPILNDQVGGVTVTIPEGLENADPAFVAGRRVTLTGAQAEKFVRSRMILDNDTNEFRMERQQLFLSDWKDKAAAKLNSDAGFAMSLTLILSDYMDSDMTANQLSDFANTLNEYTDLGTLKTEGRTLGEGPNRQFREFYIDNDDLQLKVIELFYEEAPE